MLSRDFAERILGNANKIFMALESTQTAMEAERYWGEEIARKQSYNTSEGYTDSGRYLSPMRYLNPQRSKSLQDRKGWIEGWEPRIKADEFIHGLGIGEAYLRHNGRPAKVKLVRADINPPRDFDLSGSLPRFSQGNEPPLNLTEKVNKVVMERMRAARNNSKDEPRMTHNDRRNQGKKQCETAKAPKNIPRRFPRPQQKMTGAEINDVVVGSGEMKENVSPQAATHIDSLKALSPESVETTDARGSLGSDQKQKDTLKDSSPGMKSKRAIKFIGQW